MRTYLVALLTAFCLVSITPDADAQNPTRSRGKKAKVKIPYKLAVVPATMANDEIEPIFVEMGNDGWEFQREIPRGNDLILVFSKTPKAPESTPILPQELPYSSPMQPPINIPTNNRTTFGDMTLPSGSYLEHYPEYIPPEPIFPLQSELASMSGTSALESADPLVVDEPLRQPSLPQRIKPQVLPEPRVQPDTIPPSSIPNEPLTAPIKLVGKAQNTTTVIKLKHAPARQMSELLLELYGSEFEMRIVVAPWNNAIVFEATADVTATIRNLVEELDTKFEGDENPSELERMMQPGFDGFGGLGGGG